MNAKWPVHLMQYDYEEHTMCSECIIKLKTDIIEVIKDGIDQS